MDRLKYYLVAKGYNQCPGLDDKETFNAIVKLANIRSVLTIVVMNGWELRQIDVNNAFLHRNLTKLFIWWIPCPEYHEISVKNWRKIIFALVFFLLLRQPPFPPLFLHLRRHHHLWSPYTIFHEPPGTLLATLCLRPNKVALFFFHFKAFNLWFSCMFFFYQFCKISGCIFTL